MERLTDLEEYNPKYQGLKACLLTYIARWAQIQLSDWFSRKWERGVREPFPNLTVLWIKMDLQEYW